MSSANVSMPSLARQYISERDFNSWDCQHYRKFVSSCAPSQANGKACLVIQGQWIGEVYPGQSRLHYWSIEFTNTGDSLALLEQLRNRETERIQNYLNEMFELTEKQKETLYKLKFLDPTVRQFRGFFTREQPWKCYCAPRQTEDVNDPARHNCVAPFIDETEREVPYEWKKANYEIGVCYKFVDGSAHEA